MKVIGFSAGGVGREGNIDRMVKAILEKRIAYHLFCKSTPPKALAASFGGRK